MEQTLKHIWKYMYIFIHIKNRQSVALKVKIDRDEPTIESLRHFGQEQIGQNVKPMIY